MPTVLQAFPGFEPLYAMTGLSQGFTYEPILQLRHGEVRNLPMTGIDCQPFTVETTMISTGGSDPFEIIKTAKTRWVAAWVRGWH